jgi:hypothetical protein
VREREKEREKEIDKKKERKMGNVIQKIEID